MQYVNVVFDEEYNDVDIILVPKYIAESIEQVVQEFNLWLKDSKNSKRFLVKYINGGYVLGIGTKEFLWWLNNIKITVPDEAVIIKQHTAFEPTYPIAEF